MILAFVQLSLLLPVLWATAGSATIAADAPQLRLHWIDSDGNVVSARTLDGADLEGLRQGRVVAATPWTEGVQEFTGPLLRNLAALAPYPVSFAFVKSLSDYSAEIPATDWQSYDVIVATRIGGESPRVRDKGPFWVIYPVNDMPAPLDIQYMARMVWQVSDIHFVLKD